MTPPDIDLDALFSPLLDRAKVGLAVSGGPDSLALLLLAARWAQTEPSAPCLIAYSVDHGLRPEAAGEVRFVIEIARSRGIEAHPLRWMGEKPETGLQAAAREARYRLIAEAMQRDGADLLVTAHHAQDQAETILMRLAHGSGPFGLAGMARFAFHHGVEIFRPLLETDPEELRAIVAASGLEPVRDPSNEDTSFERVRWRRLLPLLAKEGLDARRLGRFARRMFDAAGLIAEHASARYPEIVTPLSGDHLEIDHLKLLLTPRAVAVEILRRAINLVGEGKKPNALDAVESLFDALQIDAPLATRTLHGCLIRSDGRVLSIRREEGRRR